MTLIYKIVPRALWLEAEETGSFAGAPIDIADGFIHFSTGRQVEETARRHFAGQSDLLVVAIEAEVLGDALRWDPSRGGELFPHLDGRMPVEHIRWAKPLPLGREGHMFEGILV